LKKCVAITGILFLCSKILLSQPSYNYTAYSVGAGGGLVRASADLAKQINKSAVFLNLNYNYSPFTTITAEIQAGKLAGGDCTTDQHTRAFENNYKAAFLYADLQAGEYMDYRNSVFLNILKNFYAGTGFGVIHNKMGFIQRTSLNDPGYVFPGEDASTEVMLPLRFGYEFKFYDYYREPNIRVNINVQQTWVYGEGLDGYNDSPTVFKNYYVDRYLMFSVGIKYGFGNPVSYKKPIRRF
jgi:hypothetical protein